MSKIDDLKEDVSAIKLGQAVLVSKLNDWMGVMQTRHEEQRIICDRSFGATKTNADRVDNLEASRDRAVAVTKWTGIIGTPILGILGVWLKNKLGGHGP